MAAALYWAGIFALGFVLGTIRTLWLVPRLGEFAAVACELPLMLGASWFWAKHLVTRYEVTAGAPALRMGLIAFVLLILRELLLGALLIGQSPLQWLSSLGKPAAALGLAGQVGFGIFPLLAARHRA